MSASVWMPESDTDQVLLRIRFWEMVEETWSELEASGGFEYWAHRPGIVAEHKLTSAVEIRDASGQTFFLEDKCERFWIVHRYAAVGGVFVQQFDSAAEEQFGAKQCKRLILEGPAQMSRHRVQ